MKAYVKGLKHDDGKPRWSLMPLIAVEEVVHVLTHGSAKYSDNNWKRVKPFKDRYFSACMRHLTAWQAGERKDPETGRSHLAHAICCLIFLLWKELKNEARSNGKG
jgi:hypothetical protein